MKQDFDQMFLAHCQGTPSLLVASGTSILIVLFIVVYYLNWTCTIKAILTSTFKINHKKNKRHTSGLTVPEGHRSFILGHEASSTGEAQDTAWFWLVEAQRAGLAWAEPIIRKVTNWTLTWGDDRGETFFLVFISSFYNININIQIFWHYKMETISVLVRKKWDRELPPHWDTFLAPAIPCPSVLGHGSQESCPTVSWYVPGGHWTHCSCSPL